MCNITIKLPNPCIRLISIQSWNMFNQNKLLKVWSYRANHFIEKLCATLSIYCFFLLRASYFCLFFPQDEIIDFKTMKDIAYNSMDELDTEDLYMKLKVIAFFFLLVTKCDYLHNNITYNNNVWLFRTHTHKEIAKNPGISGGPRGIHQRWTTQFEERIFARPRRGETNPIRTAGDWTIFGSCWSGTQNAIFSPLNDIIACITK